MTEEQIIERFKVWRKDWKLFAREMLQVNLDPEQEAILESIQYNPMTSVASGTARGKDFVGAVAAICFLYLTPVWDQSGKMLENTKVFITATTDNQIANVMVPEIHRIFNNAKHLPGRLVGHDIKTDYKEWFLTGFTADPTKPERWAGLHASHILFIATEATGISDPIFTTIEGNLQGDSRIVLLFNPNLNVGYAADSQRSPRWNKFRLNSLSAPNVIAKRQIVPGQVDYNWVKDKVENWTERIEESEIKAEEGDFQFEGSFYRPNDEFRKKVLGLFPKVAEGVLVPPEWVDIANKRWTDMQSGQIITRLGQAGTPAFIAKGTKPLRLGADIAGMGRDNSVFCFRHGNYVDKFKTMHAGGKAEHMQVAGIIHNDMKANTSPIDGLYAQSFLDTIGEGAGTYSRLIELSKEKGYEFLADRVHSVKFSEKAEWGDVPLKDITLQREFLNMRAYLYWAVRDWLNPQNKNNPALPPDEELKAELSQTLYKETSNGKIQIEAKDDIKKRLKRSPDKADSLANTFYPVRDIDPRPAKRQSAARFFPG